MTISCRLNWHNWSEWVEEIPFFSQYRCCLNCKKKQRRVVKLKY